MSKNNLSVIIKTGSENMQQKEVINLLRQTIWARDREETAIIKSLSTSICYGAFTNDGRQIGFARVITDYATHYYICDVIVDMELRGKGIGKQLLGAISENALLRPLLGMLITEEAEQFYEPFGFERNTICFMTKQPE